MNATFKTLIKPTASRIRSALLPWLLCLWACTAATFAADSNPTVTWTFRGVNGALQSNVIFQLTPIQLSTQSNSIIAPFSYSNLVRASGQIIITNVVPQSYRATARSGNAIASWTNCFSGLTGSIDADAYICGAQPTNGIAYSTSQADARFVARSFGYASNLTVTATSTPSPSAGQVLTYGPGGVVVWSNAASGGSSAWSVRTNGSLAATNPVALVFTNSPGVQFVAVSNAAGVLVSAPLISSGTNAGHFLIESNAYVGGELIAAGGLSIAGQGAAAQFVVNGGSGELNIGQGETTVGPGYVYLNFPGPLGFRITDDSGAGMVFDADGLGNITNQGTIKTAGRITTATGVTLPTGDVATLIAARATWAATTAGSNAIPTLNGVATNLWTSNLVVNQFVLTNNATTNLSIRPNGSATNLGLTIAGNGFVGINTNLPQAALEVQGGLRVSAGITNSAALSSAGPLISGVGGASAGAGDISAARSATIGSIKLGSDGAKELYRSGNGLDLAGWTTLTIGGSGAFTVASAGLSRSGGDFMLTGGDGVTTGVTNGLRLFALHVGPSGGRLTNTLYVSATLDFPSTAAGTVSDLPITLSGAADGDIVALGLPSGSITTLTGSYQAWASNGVCYVRFANNNLVSAQDPASGTFKIRLDKFQ